MHARPASMQSGNVARVDLPAQLLFSKCLFRLKNLYIAVTNLTFVWTLWKLTLTLKLGLASGSNGQTATSLRKVWYQLPRPKASLARETIAMTLPITQRGQDLTTGPSCSDDGQGTSQVTELEVAQMSRLCGTPKSYRLASLLAS
jgi:hypothetical protein